jgi:Uma2 family endonuclease
MIAMKTLAKPITLAEFLEQPETQPASEFVNGEIIQKPMPQGEHSRLQAKLGAAINQVAEGPKIAYAFPELRCSFGGRSVIPDVAVFRWSRIPLTPSGRVDNRFLIHPDWAIEILSPDQRQTLVLDNLLHCSEQGTELGWLLDPITETLLVVWPDRRVHLLRDQAILPVLPGIELTLTVEQVFSWLTL